MPDRPAESVDPARPRTASAFDTADEFSGQDYHRDREAALGRDRPSGAEDTVLTGGDPARPGGRAHFDAKTGEVYEQGLPEGETGNGKG